MTRGAASTEAQGTATRPGVNLEPNIEDPDGFYEDLLKAHERLSTEQSFELNVRLLMLLANQIGRREVLTRCIELARAAGRQSAPDPAASEETAS